MPRRKRKNDQEDNSSGSPAWMTTFGDLMTLLLVFFVLLYSFSVIDLEKFRGFMSALQNQLGVMEGGRTISESDVLDQGMQGENFNPSQNNLRRVYKNMQGFIKENDLQSKVSVEMTQRGLVIRMTGEILYDIGEAIIKPTGKKVLDEIGKNIEGINNNVKVDGHTDNLPINNNQYPSNWELSTARAVKVIKYFIETRDIIPARLSAAGYSKYRPLKENINPENRALNRRVEVVIMNTMLQQDVGSG
ncbi:MAG TPA: flagellar motor protein MotB [Halanaerobiales bacterium]|nr:flagellar motor protein MotB [Halanaerobiales bacterium]